MAEDCAVAVDLAVLEGADGTPRSVLAWGDRARVLRRDGER